MSLRKDYSYQLYNSNLDLSNKWTSNYYAIFYGKTPQHSYHFKFPSHVRSKDDKREFLGLTINAFRNVRIKKNKQIQKKRQAIRPAPIVKQWTVQLYTKDYIETSSWSATNYVIFFGDTPVHRFIESIPTRLKTKLQKASFFQRLIRKIKKEKDEALRIRREKKKRKDFPKTIEEIEQYDDEPYQVEVPEAREFEISVSKKKLRGVFKDAVHDFRHTVLEYEKPIHVDVRDKKSFETLKDIIREDMKVAMDKAYKYKGEKQFILKFITPFYDTSGNLMYSDIIYEKDSAGNKTGREYKVDTMYSYGFSIGRTARGVSRNTLNMILEETLAAWERKISDKYDSLTSRIDISGLMVEEYI